MWRSNASFGSFTFAPGAGKSKCSDLLDFEAEETEDVPGFFSGSVPPPEEREHSLSLSVMTVCI